MRSRIKVLLGPLSLLLEPWGVFAFCLTGWAATATLSDSPVAVGVCWWGIGMFLFSIQIERPWLETFPFPPLTVLSLHLFLRWELGGLLGLIGGTASGETSQWKENLPEALAINAIFTTCLVLAGLVNYRAIRSTSHHAKGLIGTSQAILPDTFSRIITLALVTSVIAIGYSYVGFFSGTLDRGASYLQWAGRLWRPDSFFSATIRLRDLFFLLVPVVLLKWKLRPRLAVVLAALTSSSLLLTTLLGGRGLLIYPLLMMLGGLWMSGINPKLVRWLVLISLAISLLAIPSFSLMRSNKEFKSSSSSDFKARFSVLKQSLARSTSENKMLTLTGRQLYAWSDPYLFKSPATSLKPAGLKRLENLRFVWVPRFLFPDRPEINDSHLIANEIMGKPDQGKYQGRYVSFKSVSFGGDLYWRFRWPGVAIGSIVFAAVYTLFCRAWYAFAAFNGSVNQLLFALFPATFLQGPPLRSVSETAWNWLYELPKYALLLFAIGIFIDFLSGRMRSRRHSAEN